ncbi:MAG: FAD-dependent oxidoreductase [Oscillospiraceae bacterium]|nr:FAD-dependent oxidoreductase [Oscillospiraceae bacterium]
MKAGLVVIGAGPAGLAAAVAARESGIDDVVIIERDREAGGILNQCIHSGFGLRYFKTELTGPEYAERFRDKLEGGGIRLLLDTMALSVSSREVTALSAKQGLIHIESKAVVLAMGCRERTRSAIATPGSRPSGIMTAGLAQRYINIEGRMIGRRAVILGSGDIGLIMARRLSLEGAKVLACVEIMPFSSGLARNIAQCLNDYDIPLLLSHTVTDIRGRERLSGVTVAKVDEKLEPVEGSKTDFECDTLLLSVGLIPENELSRAAGIAIDPKTKGPVVYDNNETSMPGVFACGNVLQVHDLVDYVTEEGERAGVSAARYILGQTGSRGVETAVFTGENISYVLPQKLRLSQEGSAELYFRVKRPMKRADIVIREGGRELRRLKRQHLAPGEMEVIEIAKKDIKADITVAAEET